MALDATRADLTIGVIGTGSMGRGIMQVSALGGLRVLAFDAKPGAAAAARHFVGQMIDRQVAKGTLPTSDAQAAHDRVRVTDDIAKLAGCDVIVEAIVEDLDAKKALFASLDKMTGPDTILASNTSSLPITAIAAACTRPERVAGLHFFNPVPLMRLVEVIPGLRTADWVPAALLTISRRMTREPILCADSPGFVVNHVGRAYLPEALRILSETISDVAGIDRILSGAPGFRMGPFTLSDLVGLDVGHAVMESMQQQYYGEPAYAASPLMAVRVAGGMLGQKTGRGWYAYEGGRKQEPLQPAPQQVLQQASSAPPVWIRPHDVEPEWRGQLADVLSAAGANIETGNAPSADAIIIAMPIGWSLATACADLSLDARRTVAVDMLFGLAAPRTLMVTPATLPHVRDTVRAWLGHDGHPAVVINDSPGFVAQRMVANIVNIGCNIAQRAIALPADIDKAAKLGLSYPFGPLEWGDRIGAKRILHILDRLEAFYRDPRYRPSPWLQRRAALGLSLLTPDAAL